MEINMKFKDTLVEIEVSLFFPSNKSRGEIKSLLHKIQEILLNTKSLQVRVYETGTLGTRSTFRLGSTNSCISCRLYLTREGEFLFLDELEEGFIETRERETSNYPLMRITNINLKDFNHELLLTI